MKGIRFILPLLILGSSSILADFTRSHMVLHPQYPGNNPFFLEISGTWPSDCHPGEQRPVVRSFDGQRLEVEFEIVVVHITCNPVDTEFRSLLDVSPVLRDTKATGKTLTVSLDFLGAKLEGSLDLACPTGDDCEIPRSAFQRPERGLYVTPGRASEGLLIARQEEVTVVYPLVYDQSGGAEWLFSVGRIAQDTFFAQTYRWSGGDCFDCDPGDATADMIQTGYLSVLVDRPGTLLVSVNDRPFSEYQRLVYGYPVYPFEPPGEPPLTGLQGRWALSENRGTDPPLGDLSKFLPPAFDLVLESITAGDAAPPAVAAVTYLVKTITGEQLGQLICAGQISPFKPVNVCDFIDPTDASEPLLLFFQDSPSSLSIEYGRPVISIGVPPGGTAVRLD